MPPARRAPHLAGQARRAKAVLPRWSLLIAFGAAIVTYATIGIAAYLALSGVAAFLGQLIRRASRRAATMEIMDE
jgi:ABC-type uncharacterized transport system permease subunit